MAKIHMNESRIIETLVGLIPSNVTIDTSERRFDDFGQAKHNSRCTRN